LITTVTNNFLSRKLVINENFSCNDPISTYELTFTSTIQNTNGKHSRNIYATIKHHQNLAHR